MRQKFWLFVLLLTLSSQAWAQERITSYDSQIIVNPDASLTVTETIDVVATGNQIKRGIYRDFPTRYWGEHGKVTVVGFEVVEILRDGRPEPYHIENRSNGKRVYIGQSDVYLQPGPYEYTIIYKTDRQLGHFGERDELYWNVTGNGWVFPMEKVTAEVVLPLEVPPDKVAAESYSGPEGSKGTMAEYSIDPRSPRVLFRTTQPLGSYEGLTIVVSWPAGFVQRPSESARVLYAMQEAIAWIIGILGLGLLLAYYVVTWSKVGDDPERGTTVPQWEIPEGLSPAAVRFINRMRYDNKAFASALLNMAVKRYIKIVKEGKTYTIEKDEEAAQGVLPTEEQMAADSLFKMGNSIELKNDNHVTIAAALGSLGHYLNDRYAAKYFARNTGYIFPGLGLSALVLWLSARTSHDPATVWIFVVPLLIINIIFYRLLRCVTIPGRRLMDRLEGLRMYLTIAEQDRLNTLNPPERTPELFEKFLPYALALDVEHRWAEQFTDILAKAGVGGEPYQPAWYVGSSSWSDLGSGRFVSSVGDSLAGAISSSSTAPGSSSGSGGGGSSGGGGGGGGGGG